MWTRSGLKEMRCGHLCDTQNEAEGEGGKLEVIDRTSGRKCEGSGLERVE